MPESYIKAEIVRPKWTTEVWVEKVIGAFMSLALTALVVFWFVATWFPQWGPDVLATRPARVCVQTDHQPPTRWAAAQVIRAALGK